MIKDYFRKKQMEKLQNFVEQLFMPIITITVIIATIWFILASEYYETNLPTNTYTIVLIKPDGDVYKTYQLESRKTPFITADAGQSFLKYYPKGTTHSSREHIPNGWRAEISPPSIEL